VGTLDAFAASPCARELAAASSGATTAETLQLSTRGCSRHSAAAVTFSTSDARDALCASKRDVQLRVMLKPSNRVKPTAVGSAVCGTPIPVTTNAFVQLTINRENTEDALRSSRCGRTLTTMDAFTAVAINGCEENASEGIDGGEPGTNEGGGCGDGCAVS
jgi:hypothetical protein